MTILDYVPPAGHRDDPDAVFERFSAWAGRDGLSLYPHQDEALIEILSGANVVVSENDGSVVPGIRSVR